MPDRVTSLKLVCAQPLTAPAEHARSPLSFSEVDDTRFVGKYRWVHRTVDRLLVRSRVHGTASCSRVVCTTHRSRVTQPHPGPFT